MWMYTKHGVFSVVKRNDNCWQVRARREHYLTDLLESSEIDVEIVSTPNRDYAFRVFVDKAEYTRLFTYFMESIDYPDFKSHLGLTGFFRNEVDHEVYLGAYNTYWDAAMADLYV